MWVCYMKFLWSREKALFEAFTLIYWVIQNRWEGPIASPVDNFFLVWYQIKAFFIPLISDQVAECNETFIYYSTFVQ